MSRIFLSILCLGFLVACNEPSEFLVPDDTPAPEIFALANAQIERGRYQKAGDYFLEVERLYPYSPESEQALSAAAQAYHDAEALVESRAVANRYLQFFPGGRDAAMVQYLLALSYYDGIVDISRDQSRTFEALKALQIVMERYPQSEYAALSEPKFQIALDQLAGKEMEIGRYYLSKGHFASAINRFRAVIDEYPTNPQQAEAYHRIIEANMSLGLVEEANRVYRELQNFAPDSEWVARSQSLIQTGSQDYAGASDLRQILTGNAL